MDAGGGKKGGGCADHESIHGILRQDNGFGTNRLGRNRERFNMD